MRRTFARPQPARRAWRWRCLTLAHLRAVEAGQPLDLGVQRLRLGQDGPAGAAKVAGQAFPIARADIAPARRRSAWRCVSADPRPSCRNALRAALEGLRIVLRAASSRARRASASKSGSRPYRWLKRRATSRVISTCDDLVLADRHVARPVDQDVGRLQQRVAEEAVGREVAVLQLLDLVLVGRHALQPAERRAHREQREQLGVLGQAALDEDRRALRVEARGEPVDHHLVDVLLDDLARPRSAWSARASRRRSRSIRSRPAAAPSSSARRGSGRGAARRSGACRRGRAA